MSPVGGPGARRLRGAADRGMLEITCTCEKVYKIPERARPRAKCLCGLRASDVPDRAPAE
jgi:hypothetical protein